MTDLRLPDYSSDEPLFAFLSQNGCGLRDCRVPGARCPLSDHHLTPYPAPGCAYSGAELRAAMGRMEFTQRFQPIFNLGSRRQTGAEALIRWERGGKEFSPASFLPCFSALGMLVELDYYVLCQVIRLSRSNQPFPPDFSLFVNVYAPSLFDAGFMLLLESAVESLAERQARLVVEVVEYSQVHPAEIRPALYQARSAGALVALDDFGAGYANLLYLQNLPVDILKIDREIVQGIGKCRRSEVILSSVLRLARSLGVIPLAEGIETDEQERWLRENWSQETLWVQGFLFGRPDRWNAMLPERSAGR